MEANKFTLVIDGLRLSATGIVDAAAAEQIAAQITDPNATYMLDFGQVEALNYGALRTLLHHRQVGYRFMIINVTNTIGSFIERSGVSSSLNICYKPRAIKMEDYTRFGESYVTSAYNSNDGDTMIKLANDCAPGDVFLREKVVARAALQFGLHTPIVGDLVECDGRMGLEFERIHNKMSFARAISRYPDQLRDYALRFAHMARTLHTTQCDTTIFENRANFYHNLVNGAKHLTDEQKQGVHAFIDSVPYAKTCIHGDMHIGNVITDGKSDLWIDLSDFGYGNPLFDLGMFYFISHCNPEQLTMDLYHITNAQFREVWDIFLDEYYGISGEEARRQAEQPILRTAALHALYLGETYGMLDNLRAFIDKHLLA